MQVDLYILRLHIVQPIPTLPLPPSQPPQSTSGVPLTLNFKHPLDIDIVSIEDIISEEILDIIFSSLDDSLNQSYQLSKGGVIHIEKTERALLIIAYFNHQAIHFEY